MKLGIMIPCAPDNVDKLTKAALEEIDRIKTKGLTQDEIIKEKETEIRTFEKEQKDNSAWLSKLESIYKNGEDETRVANTQKLVDLVTSENIQNFLKKYVDTGKFIKIVLYPEKK
jgi:zinc protease